MNVSIIYAVIAGAITWAVTALGAATVLFFNNTSQKTLENLIGFSSGVMVAASFWSLLCPAIEKADKGILQMFFIVSGIFFGIFIMILSEKVINYFSKTDKLKYKNKNLLLLILSITIHNIPEGLAVGVAFGSNNNNSLVGFLPAISVATGIAIQNFPEGAAISLPLLNSGCSKKKSFTIGQLSAIVEPVFAFVGAVLVCFIERILPFCLSFAAGCMLYVVIDELLPSITLNKTTSNIFFFAGFVIMMLLDVLLG